MSESKYSDEDLYIKYVSAILPNKALDLAGVVNRAVEMIHLHRVQFGPHKPKITPKMVTENFDPTEVEDTGTAIVCPSCLQDTGTTQGCCLNL